MDAERNGIAQISDVYFYIKISFPFYFDQVVTCWTKRRRFIGNYEGIVFWIVGIIILAFLVCLILLYSLGFYRDSEHRNRTWLYVLYYLEGFVWFVLINEIGIMIFLCHMTHDWNFLIGRHTQQRSIHSRITNLIITNIFPTFNKQIRRIKFPSFRSIDIKHSSIFYHQIKLIIIIANTSLKALFFYLWLFISIFDVDYGIVLSIYIQLVDIDFIFFNVSFFVISKFQIGFILGDL